MESPHPCSFVFYRYGPFSRDLRAELTGIRADGFLEHVIQPAPYGPGLLATDAARQQLQQRWPKMLARYGTHLDFVADELGALGVGDLERLATALLGEARAVRCAS